MNIRQTLLSASLALALASLAACGSTPPQATAAPATPVAAPAVQQTAAAAAASAAYDFDMDVFHPVVANNGMVATEQELASRIGLDILKAGGNAVDAAVGIGFALAVALPNAGNIGGGGFMMVHDAKTGKSVALDFREVAPLKASRNMYLETRDLGEMMEIYSEAWNRGVKTTYYLHMKPRHTAEQSTVKVNKSEDINAGGGAPKKGFGFGSGSGANPEPHAVSAVAEAEPADDPEEPVFKFHGFFVLPPYQ